MKKIVSILCALSLIIGSSSNVFATEIYGDGSASTTITYTTPSQYCVYIPESIDLTMDSYTFTASVMDIAENEQVLICITNLNSNNQFEMSSGVAGRATAYIWNNSTKMKVENFDPVATFLPGSLESSMSISLNNVETSGAGTYSGTAEFTISLMS